VAWLVGPFGRQLGQCSIDNNRQLLLLPGNINISSWQQYPPVTVSTARTNATVRVGVGRQHGVQPDQQEVVWLVGPPVASARSRSYLLGAEQGVIIFDLNNVE
jgi:hypothetical protein